MPAWISDAQALSTPVIAAIVGLIAWQQFRLAKQNLRLELFDRRYAVLDVLLRESITALNQNADLLFDGNLLEMNQRLNSARFLFDDEVFDYLNSVAARILDLRHSTWTLAQTRNQSLFGNTAWMSKHNELLQSLRGNMTEMPKRLEQFLKVDDKLSFSVKPGANVPALAVEAGLAALRRAPETS